MTKIQFLNISVDNITTNIALEKISFLVENTTQSYVVTPNVDHIIMVEKDQEFKEIYENASLVLTDGQPLIWISKYFGTPIVEKISGSDLFPKICAVAAEKGYSMFFLGAAKGVADKAAMNLLDLHPNINIVGTYSPTFGFEKNEEEIAGIINLINSKKPDILILALGSPKQEKFYYKYKEKINVPVALALGASVDFAAGNIKRAPHWMSKNGFEWLYRLYKEPKRLFKRYIIDDTKILWLIIKYKRNR